MISCQDGGQRSVTDCYSRQANNRQSRQYIKVVSLAIARATQC